MRRLLCLVCGVLIGALLGGSTGGGQEVPDGNSRAWFERCLVGMEVGPTGAQFGSDPSDVGYAARFNGRDVVRRCVEAHSQYVVIWARDGAYAYYDSHTVAKCPGLGQRDVLRETVDEARKVQMPVIAYCVVQQGGRFLEQHPEYAMRDSAGNIIPGRYCLNSAYRDVMKALLAEQLAYGIDGFHIDMVDQGFGPPVGCWCDTCRKKFRTLYGCDMPDGVTWDEGWERMLEFRYLTSAEFERDLYGYVKSVKSAATVDFNYHGNPPFSWEVGQRPVMHAGNADFVTGETGVWGFSALGVGLNAEFYRAATPGQPFQVAMQRGVRMYHDQTTRPLNDLRWELLTLLTHGAFVTVVDKTAYDGWLDPVAYERIGQAFQEALAKQSHFGHQPVHEVGLWFSSRTRDWYGRQDPARYFQSFQGAHKALAYEHIPWGVILDENATTQLLRKFPVVLVPNAAVLLPDEVKLLQDYVAEGGHLILTGHSGLFSVRGEPLGVSPLEELVGARLVRLLDSLDNHVRLPSEDVSQKSPNPSLRGLVRQFADSGIRANWPFLTKGPAAVYAPTCGLPVGKLLKPHRTVRQLQGKEGTGWPMSADEPVGPAVIVNQVGRGTVLTFACSPDCATAGEHAIVEARRLLVAAVRWLNPSPRVHVTAPVHVQTVVSDDLLHRVLRVHFLAYVSPPQTTPASNRPFVLPAMIEDTPLFRAAVTVGQPVRGVAALSPRTELTRDGETIRLLVEDVHDVLMIHY